MEIGAVALLSIAGVENVPAAPSRAGLLVTHRREDVIVYGARFFQRPSFILRDLSCQICRRAGDGDQGVRLQILFPFSRRKSRFYRMRGRVQGPTLMSDDVVLN